MLEPMGTVGIVEQLRDIVRRASRSDGAQLQLPLGIAGAGMDGAMASLEAVSLQSLVDALPEGVTVVDAASRVIVHNRAAEVMLGPRRGRDLADGVAQTLPRHLDGAPYDPRELPGTRTLRDGVTIRGEGMLLRNAATGEDVPVLMSTAPLRGDNGEILGAVGIYRDIGKILERERERDAFLSLVGHEVKSPLTAVRGHVAHALRLLHRGQTDLAEASLAKADRSIARLDALLHDLLETSRVQLVHFAPRRTDVGELVRETIRKLEPRLGARVRVHAMDGSRVAADPRLLERVVANLVENAAKYSEPDAAILVAVEPGAGEVIVRVRDGGIGVPEVERARIFDPFYRATNSDGRPGSGLGLYLSRELIRRHGGSLWLERSDETGSTFAFSLPLATSA